MTGMALRATPLLVCLLAFVVFLPVLGAGFVDWDDDRNLVDNPHFRGLGWPQLRWMLTATWMGHYIPLTWLTLGLNHVAGGMEPWGYHLGNLLLHAANAGLFYLVARRLLAAGFRGAAADMAPGAAVAALVWALHPLRVESVAWVTERRDVLCALFYLAAVLAYLRAVEPGPGLSRGWRAASLAAFVAALASKGMAMTLPLSLLVVDAHPLGRARLGWRRLVTDKLPYLVLAAAGAAVAVWAVTRGAAWTRYDAYPLGARLVMTAYGFWFYPAKMVWPEGLSPLYELPPRVDLLDGRFLGPTLGVLAVTVVLLLARRRFPAGLAAWLHSIIVVAPVSGIAHAGYQLAHDRYSYLSSMGFALVAGAGATWVIRQRVGGRISRWVATAAALAVIASLVGLGVGTWVQSRIWRDSESLWQAAVAADPSCAICRHKLGNILLAARRHREAEAELSRAVALRPERAGPRVSLAALLVETNRPAEAEAQLRTAMRLAPRQADAAANLGALYARLGRNAEAVALLRQALDLAPWLVPARDNLGRALTNRGTELARQGRLVEAVPLYEEAARLLPEDPDISRSLGQALVEQGRGREAIAPLERAARLRPRGAPERFWLARAYLLTGRTAEAQVQIAALRELDPPAAAALAAAASP